MGNLSSLIDFRLREELLEVYDYLGEFNPDLYPYTTPGQLLTFNDLVSCSLPEPDQVLENMLDRGDKMLVVGHSKTRKTFFVTQLAFSLASKTDFLGIPTPKARKVLLVQYEVQPAHFIRRVRRMSHALGLKASDINQKLFVINARGVSLDFDRIQDTINKEEIEVVIFDPFYKMFEGDESDVESVKSVLAIFDRITTQSRCALIYVHHDKKGSTDKTEQRDRGGGSGILARDYDVGLAISEHDHEPDAIVIDFLLRNYQPIEPITAEWHEDSFHLSSLQPLVKKSGRRAQSLDSQSLQQSALEILKNGAIPSSAYREKVRTELGLSHTKERVLIDTLISSNLIRVIPGSGRKNETKKFELVQPLEIIEDRYF
jgi:hypothetical protein